VERIDTYMTSLERVRARLLGLVDRALEDQGGLPPPGGGAA
jgi:hypothetical protein